MTYELLALTKADSAAPPELRRVALAGHAAVAVLAGTPQEERLRLLQDLMAVGPTLPARRGMSGDPAALAALLGAHVAAIAAGLRKVAGCVELVASVRLAAPPTPETEAQGSYLRARAKALRARDAHEARAVAHAVAMLASVRLSARDTAVRGFVDAAGRIGADACALVKAEAAEQALAQLREAAAGLDADAQVSGPWPAFSFADLALPRSR